MRAVSSFRLQVREVGSDEEHAVDLDQDVVLLGRRPGLDIVLPHPEVGGVHARIERRGRELYLVDAGAAPTRIAGSPVVPGAKVLLGDGAEIELARRFRVRITLASPEGAEPTTRAATADLARRMVQNALAALGKAEPERTPFLEVTAGPAIGRKLALPAPGRDVVIGRGESCDLAIVDADLSREHLRVRRTWSVASVVDLGSKNGSRRNDDPLPAGQDVPLRHADRLSAGQTELVFRDPIEQYLASLEAPRPSTRLTPVAWIGLGAGLAAIAALVWLVVG
jgi:pSer/pThr/pTyr-binding forkhead associated (FHA) protein